MVFAPAAFPVSPQSQVLPLSTVTRPKTEVLRLIFTPVAFMVAATVTVGAVPEREIELTYLPVVELVTEVMSPGVYPLSASHSASGVFTPEVSDMASVTCARAV